MSPARADLISNLLLPVPLVQANAPAHRLIGFSMTAMVLHRARCSKNQFGVLCRVLQPAPYVFGGLCQLFELLLLHIFATFAGASLVELTGNRLLTRVGAFIGPAPFAPSNFD